ncbi:MAG: hypothetical protein AAF196_20415 [Planctomycetota bacterium]
MQLPTGVWECSCVTDLGFGQVQVPLTPSAIVIVRQPTEQDFLLSVQDCALRVIDRSGEPIEGLRMRIPLPAEHLVLYPPTTDSDGRLELALPIGAYEVSRGSRNAEGRVEWVPLGAITVVRHAERTLFELTIDQSPDR